MTDPKTSFSIEPSSQQPFMTITTTTTTTSSSDKTLLRPIHDEYNPHSQQRPINLVWRRKRATNGAHSFLTQKRFSHWGIEVVSSTDQTDGYVWELRRDPEGDNTGVLASASSLNVDRPSWRAGEIGRANTGIVTNLKDSEIQLRAQIVAATMRRPMLRGLSAEQEYGEYKNNCHRFARALLGMLVDGVDERRRLAEFLERQDSFGNKLDDPRPAPSDSGVDVWVTGDAWGARSK